MEEGSLLVAVSLKSMQREPCIGPTGSVLHSAIICGKSSNSELSFTFQTGLLNSDQVERCKGLKKHGFTVVEAPDNWRYGYYNKPGGWQEVVIQQAMKQISILEPGRGVSAMSGYDVELARAVLMAVSESFPKRLSMTELKYELDPEPSDEALMTALDALLIDGLIEGPHIHLGVRGELRYAEMVRITAKGREHRTRSSKVGSETTGDVIHGDQIITYGPVGAIGKHAVGTVNTFDRCWQGIESEIDLGRLVTELGTLRTELLKSATTPAEFVQVGILAQAECEAESSNGPGVVEKLSKVAKAVFETAERIGTDLAAKVIVEASKG